MTRTRRLKLAYLALLAAMLAAAVFLADAIGGIGGVALAVALLLVPGRVQGHVYRDFYRGRAWVAQGRWAESVPCFERFLASVRARPSIKRLLWLQFAVYTTDIEAMTLNNLGGAAMELGDADAAERWLTEALRIDPRYPVALYNLSQVAAIRGEHDRAERLLADAARLGYWRGGMDALLQGAGERLARLEGYGARA